MLYKQLNEERTQGEWTPFEGYYYGIDSSLNGNNKSVVLFGEKNEKSGFTKQIDAEYTCLAVNNLHILAEALDKIIGSMALERVERFDLLQKAKEALNRIS